MTRLIFILLSLALATPAASEPRLPEIKADTLAKETMTLPEDFSTDPALVVFSFSQDQTEGLMELEELIPDIKTGRDGLAAYNMPVIPNPGAIVRSFIRSGMRGIYETPQDRARTVVLFVDEDSFFDEAGFPSTDQPLIALVGRDGRIISSIPGIVSDETPAAFEDMLNNAGL